MEVEGLDFKGAPWNYWPVKPASIWNFALRRAASAAQTKNSLLQLLELSTKFYQVQFSKRQGRPQICL